MNKCNHFWVKRTDGYEEQCQAAICLICGRYACSCELQPELKKLPPHLQERRKMLFEKLGIEGNDHEIENSKTGRILTEIRAEKDPACLADGI